MKVDLMKIRLTITACQRALDRLEQAADRSDFRRVGSEVYNVRRELYYMRQLIGEKPPDYTIESTEAEV